MGASHRFDAPLIADAHVFGNGGLGVLAENIPSTGDEGRPSFLFNDLSLPSDSGKEIRGLITAWPTLGELFADEDGSFIYSGPDGAHAFAYQLYVDGVATGSPSTVTVTVGGFEGSASGAPSPAALAVPAGTAAGTQSGAAAGAPAAAALSQPVGTAQSTTGANASGQPQAASLSSPSAFASGTTAGNAVAFGSFAQISFAAPSAGWSASASAAPAPVGASAPTASAFAGAQGGIAPIIIGAPAAIARGDGLASCLFDFAALSAPTGAGSSGVIVQLVADPRFIHVAKPRNYTVLP